MKDFADYDDFFEATTLHDLDELLEDYSVVISFSGSRFYGTMIHSNVTFEDLFPADYHVSPIEWHWFFPFTCTHILLVNNL